MTTDANAHAAETLISGRRDFLRVASAIGAGLGVAGVAGACSSHSDPGSAAGAAATPAPAAAAAAGAVLQPGHGDRPGDPYLQSLPDEVPWGYLPTVHAKPVLQMASGQTVTVSNKGILADQGRDPVAYFGAKGVARSDVLEDAVAIASDYNRTTRDFVKDGPHVVTGPIFVEGAPPRDVLKIGVLQNIPRVPYGVVFSRYGKGSLAATGDGAPSDGITLAEVMPPASTDGRGGDSPMTFGAVLRTVPHHAPYASPPRTAGRLPGDRRPPHRQTGEPAERATSRGRAPAR